MKQVLSVIGLGKLGCTMMACFAQKGWQVKGLDVNESNVKMIQQGKCPISEPYVEDMIKDNMERITATTDYETAVLNSDVSFIIVPTPSKEDGSFSTAYIESAAMKIADVLSKKESYHLVVLTSTVLPGDTTKIAYDIAKRSGKRLGKDFGVIYNPDFIALGKIVYDFFNPDMILIGECDKRAGDIIEDIHLKLIDNKSSIHRMNLYNAELAKISLNAYCTLKITFANVIAEICEKMPGGDSEKVLGAIGSDSRVGNKYFRGGLGFSGPCLLPEASVQTEKDLREIQDIKIGDKVFTHKGRLRKVTKVYQRPYIGPMVKIISAGFLDTPLILTPEHLVWSMKNGFEGLNFIPANVIEREDKLAIPILNVDDKTEIFPDLNFTKTPEELSVIFNEDNILVTVESVETIMYDGIVLNLEVEQDNTYVLENATVHNCFPRDNRALAYSARFFNTTHYFCEITDAINNYHRTERICNLLIDYMDKKETKEIAILGLSYKENTPIIEESVSLSVIRYLYDKGISIRVYDPAAMENTKNELEGYRITYASSVYECLEGVSVCFIATPWDQFKKMDIKKILKEMKKDSVIVDAWGVLPYGILNINNKRLEVRHLGKNYD